MLADLERFGFSDNCPKCNLYRAGEKLRAQNAHHSEGCRQRIYRHLSQEGSFKFKKGLAEGRVDHKLSEPNPTNATSLATRLLSDGKFTSLPADHDFPDHHPDAASTTPGDYNDPVEFDAVIDPKDQVALQELVAPEHPGVVVDSIIGNQMHVD